MNNSFSFNGFVGDYKILYGTGTSQSTFSGSVQIIDLETPFSTCNTPQDYPLTIIASRSIMYNNTPLVCGGVQNSDIGTNKCYQYTQVGWRTFPPMLINRRGYGLAFAPYLDNPTLLLASGISLFYSR